jgi:hypothetical protein
LPVVESSPSGGGRFFPGDSHFSAREKANLDILGNFGHLGAQKVPKWAGLTLFERNLVESHFEANRTLVKPDFGRKELGRISFWCKPDFGRTDRAFLSLNRTK